MSTHNIRFFLRNKKDTSIFRMKKSTLSVAMFLIQENFGGNSVSGTSNEYTSIRGYPHSNTFFHFFSVEKIYYMHKATSVVNCVKPNASQ